jgi:AraC family transcriptional regulator of adaptative response / DNA-3-methyladenine glycosylase II
LLTPDGGAVLEISLEREGAWCRVHAEEKMGRESMAQLHSVALKMLGLNNEVSLFETRMGREARTAPMIARQRGLRLPCIPTNFDGLCWAIIGQQINVKFATALRREIIQLGGEKVGDMTAHPSPARVVDIGATALAKRRYSRSKADYLMGAAREVAEGRLDVEGLTEGSATAAEKKLTSVRGIGTWTARYYMLRGGFADSAPVRDSALATALQRLHGREDRPGHDEVHTMMQSFAPHRSLATAHLWASLKDAV